MQNAVQHSVFRSSIADKVTISRLPNAGVAGIAIQAHILKDNGLIQRVGKTSEVEVIDISNRLTL